MANSNILLWANKNEQKHEFVPHDKRYLSIDSAEPHCSKSVKYLNRQDNTRYRCKHDYSEYGIVEEKA
jgi:hypothetical protein